MAATEEREISFYGDTYSVGCPGCNRVNPQPPALECVYENNLFRVHQDYELPIPGMMVVETVRHVRSLTDFSPEELAELPVTLFIVRAAMRTAGIPDIATLVQEEKSGHFHAWYIPIYPWMSKVTTKGKNRDFQPIFDYAKDTLMTPEQFAKVEVATKHIKTAVKRISEKDQDLTSA